MFTIFAVWGACCVFALIEYIYNYVINECWAKYWLALSRCSFSVVTIERVSFADAFENSHWQFGIVTVQYGTTVQYNTRIHRLKSPQSRDGRVVIRLHLWPSILKVDLHVVVVRPKVTSLRFSMPRQRSWPDSRRRKSRPDSGWPRKNYRSWLMTHS